MLDMLSVHKELEASILKDITRRILKSGFVTDTASYQAEKLNEAGLCYNEILDEISTRTKKCREEIKKSFSDAETKVFDYDESVLANAGINAHEFKKISPRMKRIITASLAKPPRTRRRVFTYRRATWRICRLCRARLTTTRLLKTR